jgi:hypothetical protein
MALGMEKIADNAVEKAQVIVYLLVTIQFFLLFGAQL